MQERNAQEVVHDQVGPTRTDGATTKSGTPTAVRSSTVAHHMTCPAHAVHTGDSLNDAARIMWERDVGGVPVVNEEGRPVGIVTDRDLAMSAYLNGRCLSEIPVDVAMSRDVRSVRADDPLHRASDVMSRRRVRRTPVVDDTGTLVGMLSLGDLACASGSSKTDSVDENDVARTLRSVSTARTPAADPIKAATRDA